MSNENSTPTTDVGNPQAIATTTLTGIVAYLVYELTNSGLLDTRSFHKHLEALSSPDSPDETAAEKLMRTSIINVVRTASKQGNVDEQGS